MPAVIEAVQFEDRPDRNWLGSLGQPHDVVKRPGVVGRFQVILERLPADRQAVLDHHLSFAQDSASCPRWR